MNALKRRRSLSYVMALTFCLIGGLTQWLSVEAALTQLQNDNGIADSYSDGDKANTIVGAILTPLATQLPLRIESVNAMFYRFPGAMSSVQVRASIYAVVNGAPGALLGRSNISTVNTFYPSWATINLSTQNIVITTPQSFMAAIEYVNGTQGATPGITVDTQAAIASRHNWYSFDSGATWREHYDHWLDPGCVGYNMIRATVNTNLSASASPDRAETIVLPMNTSGPSSLNLRGVRAPSESVSANSSATFGDWLQSAQNMPQGAVARGEALGMGKQHVLARDSLGRLQLVFRGEDHVSIFHATSTNNGQSWLTPTRILQGTSLEGSLAIDSQNRLHLNWGNASLNNGCALYTQFNGTQWVSTTRLGVWAFGRNIAVDGADRVHAFWSNADTLYARYQNGNWSAPTTIANNAWHPAVSIDAADQLHVTYNDSRPFSDPTVQAHYIRSLNGGNTWSSDTNLSQSNRWSASTAIVAAPNGSLHATFVTQGVFEGDLNYTFYANGVWSTPLKIASGVMMSTPGRESAAMTVDRDGNLFLVYSCRNALNFWDICLLAKSALGWEPVVKLTNNMSFHSAEPSVAYGMVSDAGLDITWGSEEGYVYYRNVKVVFPRQHIKIVDPNGKPLAGARLYRNGAPVTLANGALATTNFDGLLGFDDLQGGELLVALVARDQHMTSRAGHNLAPDPNFPAVPWAYRVYNTSLTNTTTAGPANPFVLPNAVPSLVTLTVSPSNTLILFNIVASLEWKADLTSTQQISHALRLASDYLYTVSDGQMAFEQVQIFDDAKNWADADFQFSAKNMVRPQAPVGGLFTAGGVGVKVGRLWDGLSGNAGSWDQANGFRTLIHEFGHYALTLQDEYFYYTYNASGVLTGVASSDCTSNAIRAADFITNASIMDYQYTTSKLAMKDSVVWSPQCLLTYQWQAYGQSDWERVRTVFSDTAQPARWQLITPLERGGVVAGPNGLSALNLPLIVVSQTQTIATAARTLKVLPQGPNAGALVALYTQRNGVMQAIDQGLTNGGGLIALYGSASGDVVRAASWDGSYVGSVILDDAALVTLTLTALSPLRTSASLTSTLPAIRLVPQANGDLLLNVSGFSAGAALSARIDQPGGSVLGNTALAYSSSTGDYTGQVNLSGITPGQGTVMIAGTDALSQSVNLATVFSLQRITPTIDSEVWSSDGNAMLYLPAGAFSTTTYVAITTRNAPPGDASAFTPLVGHAYEVRFSGAVVTLAKPAMLWLRYHADQRGAESPQALALIGYDPNQGWRALAATHDRRERTLTRAVTGSGIFALGVNWPFKAYLPLVVR